MKKLLFFIFITNLSANSICDEPVPKFESNHGKLEITIIDQINKTPIVLKKNTYNICRSYEEFLKDEENTKLLKKFKKEKYGNEEIDVTSFLELFLKKDRPDAFLENISREKYIEAKDYLNKKTYLY